uniref:hypothetical protein n=1 Tax=Segatella hominis TaxID=2518605 RepID=UPI003AB954B6
MTYDLVNDNSNASVMLANGSAYQVRGEALDRFGVLSTFAAISDTSFNIYYLSHMQCYRRNDVIEYKKN